MKEAIKKFRLPIIIVLVAAVAGGIVYRITRPPQSLVLTGIVSTDDVRVASEIQGRLAKLLVHQGDTVKKGQLLALIQPKQWQADMNYYQSIEQESAAQVTQAQDALALQEAQTREEIKQSEANLAMDKAQELQAKADLEYAGIAFRRAKAMRSRNVNSQQDYDQARTSYAAATAHVKALESQVQAAEAALALARAGINQIAARKAALAAAGKHLAAASAQTEKAGVILGYTRIVAPISGIVDVRAALRGEVVTPGQAIVTLINPDDLWVRADVEESYIDRIHLGEKLTVRLPDGTTRPGTIFFRSVDADFATQRDVSRTKRDIKTFKIRLRCDNRDRALALGMTAYVTLPLQ